MEAGKVVLGVGVLGAAAGGSYLILRKIAKAEPEPEPEPEPESSALSLGDLYWIADGHHLQNETVEQGQATNPLLVKLDNTGAARSFRVEIYLGTTLVISNLLISCPEDGSGSNQAQILITDSFPIGNYIVKIKAIDQSTGTTELETSITAFGVSSKLYVVEPYEPEPGPGPGPGGETVQVQLASVWNQVAGAGVDYSGYAVWACRNDEWLAYQYNAGVDQIGYFQTGDLVWLYNMGGQITLTYGGRNQKLQAGWNEFTW